MNSNMNETEGRRLPAALVLGGALTVARVLTKYGVDVYGSDFGFSVDRWSRLVKRPPWGYTATLDDQFLEAMVRFARKQEQKPVLIPAADVVIEFVMKHYEVLSTEYHLAGANQPGIGASFLEKKSFYGLCDQAGIAYPKTIFCDRESFDPKAVTDRLRFPVIVKPNLIHRWKPTLKGEKVLQLGSAVELEDVARKYPGLLEESMLQEVIPGPEENICLFKGCFDRQGNVLDTFTGRKLRQYPPMFGSASLAESVENEQVMALSLKFFERIRVHGLGGTEFKWDPRDDEYKMIEVNMRPQLWDDLIRAAGKDLQWTHYCDLIGRDPGPPGVQVNGVRWVHLTRDVVSALWFMRRKELSVGQWLRGYRRGMVDALMQLDDPLTIPGAFGYAAYQAFHYKIMGAR